MNRSHLTLLAGAPWVCHGLALLSVLACAGPASEAAPSPGLLTIKKEAGSVIVRSAEGTVLLQYQLQRPAQSELSVPSGGYFHPLATPSGVVLTDVAPSDHRHHRGVFLAWVEMHGSQSADFWGWGEHAPVENRRIVNVEVSDLQASQGKASFRVRNHWLAEEAVLLSEELQTTIHTKNKASVLDLQYRLLPSADLTLARWAFSGFCVRARKDGKLDALGPDGPVSFANPKHTEPDSDWPASRWYGYTLRLEDGKTVGVAVIDHPNNPPALWHNHRDIRMLNPCIVAPAKVQLRAAQPLILRYRVIAQDAPLQPEAISRLALGFEQAQ